MRETDCVVVCVISLQSVVLERFAQFVDDAPVEYGIHSVSSKMCDLLGLWLLEKHLNVLYEGTVRPWCSNCGDVSYEGCLCFFCSTGRYCSGGFGKKLKDTILLLCEEVCVYQSGQYSVPYAYTNFVLWECHKWLLERTIIYSHTYT